MKKIILTGIRSTGIPHIGNYYGSIKPLMNLQTEYHVFQLIADLHAIPHVRDPLIMNDNVRTITACYLACGLDVERSVIWRQSQIQEMAWIALILMSLLTADELNEVMEISNNGNMDLVSCLYPTLMAADTLMMGADLVFAGRDHVNGLMLINKLSQKYNAVYGDILIEPESIFSDLNEMVRGLDGRKMSKSFNNTISIIESEEDLYRKIMGLQGVSETDSFATIVDLLSHSLSSNELEAVKEKIRLKEMRLPEAKNILFENLEKEISPIRDEFYILLKQPDYLNQVLLDGLRKAEEQAALRKSKILASAGFR
ncbi:MULTISPECIES: hypothetical protein [unclassified Paenibacillus]|uniref:tryptophan--tRNA ligase n=1 Tax=unclassified Paenibacillus TaxID=185978 RepID=UPI002406BBE2|nr:MULTISPECIES: hypothetical protein [unclassified Paenibacillus]MDF9844112.1 tryptophanyl-tRNA synthetase [Paenibacillus sp. PastF-2]MDF9850766.1 tryptophanyl-tRNA synthetase [Paenibacillus sp. PastM-2]MDF9857336.1 tryptophanyl-tRNA synthetase [Paenibacillus sp. PastF-1]MDH6482556.1 tryptophanyl-tRNA synthetase [Paenibacillus sp. PastH-2]MDH6509984.1 tryptophanyl-tRNA synthetase [Paenibacillus sp. PastM-3]